MKPKVHQWIQMRSVWPTWRCCAGPNAARNDYDGVSALLTAAATLPFTCAVTHRRRINFRTVLCGTLVTLWYGSFRLFVPNCKHELSIQLRSCVCDFFVIFDCAQNTEYAWASRWVIFLFIVAYSNVCIAGINVNLCI